MKGKFFALTICLMGLTPALTFADDEMQETAPAVVTLQFRNYHITMSASDKGTLYTVKEVEGKTVGEHLTAKELQAQLPEVHRFVKDAFAGDRKNFIDASNGVSLEHPGRSRPVGDLKIP